MSAVLRRIVNTLMLITLLHSAVRKTPVDTRIENGTVSQQDILEIIRIYFYDGHTEFKMNFIKNLSAHQRQFHQFDRQNSRVSK